MTGTPRAALLGGVLAAGLGAFGPTVALAEEEETAWDAIALQVFDDRPMLESGVVAIEAPYRAEDAALVPMTIRAALPEGDERRVERVTLVIDENPSPVAASFELGPEAGVTEIATRVRVESYTPVHAVAELSDGSLHMAEVFVKASGGCAAPAAKDPDEALANLGQMKLRRFDDAAAASEARAEAQLMIRHPNNSGLQMDQITRHYTPAHFVQEVTIAQGDAMILRMEGGISISEDPSFRFDYRPTGEPIRVEALDTEGGRFADEWPTAPEG